MFPDRPHLEHLRQRLWEGRAAVMVGAGFSLNASQRSTAGGTLLLWQELVGRMYDRLYPPHPGEDQSRRRERRQQAGAGLNVLRLAQEFEAAFRRDALDSLLLQALPDQNYVPGRLHAHLLSLPWADVFTTNYDTLLERTRPAVHERRYDIVQTPADIPAAGGPRIVKLHGSFPSHRPFVITEEDFRTYPARFPAFVNLVQQAIMENAFCLVGFSADDPNFLSWTGWVRDRLGDSTPNIYLCGLLDLAPSQRLVLNARRITPIDLSPLFPADRFPDRSARHAKALEWLLLSLRAGEPPSLNRWPSAEARLVPERTAGVPDLLPSPSVPTPPFAFRPSVTEGAPTPEKLLALRQTWTAQRREYPGWVVAPHELRETLWNQTRYWTDPVLAAGGALPAPENLRLCYELNWRLERTLTPLFLPQVEKLASVIGAYDPFESGNGGLTTLPTPVAQDAPSWSEVREWWVELVFALAREAREDQDPERFERWVDLIAPALDERGEWRARWHHERCLFQLGCLNLAALREALAAWAPMPDLPFWEARRAAILAELGELGESNRIAEAALATIRSRLPPGGRDPLLLSQEGWVMMLLDASAQGKDPFGGKGGDRAALRDRWERLATFRSDPWRELQELASALKQPVPGSQFSRHRRPGFDPGRESITRHYSDTPAHLESRPAFALLRLCEEAGVPPRCGRLTIHVEEIGLAAQWIEPYAALWALGVWLRAGRNDQLKEAFTRARVAGLTGEEVAGMTRLLLAPMRQAAGQGQHTADTEDASLMRRLIDPTCEMLSRLFFRLEASVQDEVLDLTMAYYRSPWFVSESYGLGQRLIALFERILAALPPERVLARLPALLDLPIPGENGYNVSEPQIHAEPLNGFHLDREVLERNPQKRGAWDRPIQNLLRVLRDGSPDARLRAACRLRVVEELGAMSVGERDDFVSALWSRCDPDKGLPVGFAGLASFLLALPSPDLAGTKDRFAAAMLAGDYARLPRDSPQAQTRPRTRAVYDVGPSLDFTEVLLRASLNPNTAPRLAATHIDWTPEQTAVLLEKTTAWWRDDRDLLASAPPEFLGFSPDNARSRLGQMAQVMYLVILPRAAGLEPNVRKLALDLCDELEIAGLPTTQLLPATLLIAPERSGDVTRKVRCALVDSDEEQVRRGSLALYHWGLLHEANRLEIAPPSSLIEVLVAKISLRAAPALDSALDTMAELIARTPGVLTAAHQDALVAALRKLLGETAYPTSRKALAEDGSSQGSIAVAERPSCRKAAVELASQLAARFDARNLPRSEILARWREAAINDALPEVRRAWQGQLNGNNPALGSTETP